MPRYPSQCHHLGRAGASTRRLHSVADLSASLLISPWCPEPSGRTVPQHGGALWGELRHWRETAARPYRPPPDLADLTSERASCKPQRGWAKLCSKDAPGRPPCCARRRTRPPNGIVPPQQRRSLQLTTARRVVPVFSFARRPAGRPMGCPGVVRCRASMEGSSAETNYARRRLLPVTAGRRYRMAFLEARRVGRSRGRRPRIA